MHSGARARVIRRYTEFNDFPEAGRPIGANADSLVLLDVVEVFAAAREATATAVPHRRGGEIRTKKKHRR